MTTGTQNVIIGGLAGDALTTGSENVVIGLEALSTEDAHGKNVAIGHQALKVQDAGADARNVAVGYQAGLDLTNGIKNVFVGNSAGENVTEGQYNTLLGANAGDALTTGDNNVVIGYNAAASAVDVNNEVNIYNGTVTARFQGSASSWSFVSDARDKKDIEDLQLGVEFINKLKPRKFKWDLRDSDVDKNKKASGFIAQEIQEVLDAENIDYSGIVDTNNPDQYMIAQANIIPMLVKSIHELSAKVKMLENK